MFLNLIPESRAISVLVDQKEMLDKNANMAINLYIRPDSLIDKEGLSVSNAYEQWQESSNHLRRSMEQFFEELGK